MGRIVVDQEAGTDEHRRREGAGDEGRRTLALILAAAAALATFGFLGWRQPVPAPPAGPESSLGELGPVLVAPSRQKGLQMAMFTPDATEIIEWSLRSGRATRIGIPIEPVSPIHMDAGGEYLAYLTGSFTWFGLLQTDRGGETATVARGVSSFAWHGSRPHRLAWIAAWPGPSPRLHRVDVDDGRRAAPVEVGGRSQSLAGWGDWGFLLEGGGDGIEVLDPAGRALATYEGHLEAVADDGRVLISDHSTDGRTQLSLVTPPAPHPETYLEVEGFAGAAWSPDGAHLAVVSGNESAEGTVLRIDGIGDPIVADVGLDVDMLSWSRDGGLLLMRESRDPRRILAFDTERQAMGVLIHPHPVEPLG